MKKIILILIAIACFSGISFADTSEVRIGLTYNEHIIDRVSLSSQNGFSFGITNEGYYVNLASFMIQNVYIEKDSLLKIEISQTFNTGQEASELVDLIKGMGYNAYSGYSDGFKVYIEHSSDQNKLNNIITDLSNTLKEYTFKLKNPSSECAVIMSGNIPIFFYDTLKFDYILKDLNNGLITFEKKNYRGAIGVKRFNNADFTVINYVSMRDYLYGVLPKEMSKSWPLEALKAQAVAARNYTYATMGKHEHHGYDLCDTTDCQVYGGADVEGPISNAAVDETDDIILTYNGNLVSAYYHSNSGGYTANIGDVWNGQQPYLVSVYDPYSIGQNQYDWTLTLSESDMNNKFKSAGYNIGTLKDIRIDKQRESGRVIEVTAVGSRGSHTFEREQFRAFLGYSTLRSMLFNLDKNATASVFNGSIEQTVDTSSAYVLSAGGMTKNNGDAIYAYDGQKKKDYTPSSDGFTFVGHGYGHGIGLSQWGAKAMAESGITYDQILTHYYKDTKLEVID